MKAGEILDRLERKFPPEKGEWATFRELADATGPRQGRIDFFAVNLWPSRRCRTVAVEVKVARQDWLRELEKPEKREAFEGMATEFWVATAKGIVEKEELPNGLGLFEVYGTGLRKIRAAAQDFSRKPDDFFWLALIRRAHERLRQERQSHDNTRHSCHHDSQQNQAQPGPPTMTRLAW